MANPFDQFDATPAAPAKPVRPRDMRPEPAQRQQAAATRSSEISAAGTAQTISQKARSFEDEMRVLSAQAARAELELAALRKKQETGDLDYKEQQALAASRAENMAYGEAIRRLALEQGYDPTSPRNKFAAVAGAIPFAGSSLSALIKDPVSEEAAVGEKSFVEGALRAATGAGTNVKERPETKEIYFPNPWSSMPPEALKRLDQKRLNQIIAQSQIAGPALAPGTRSTVKTLTTSTKPKDKRNKQGLPSGTSYLGILNPNR